jgi:glutathione peroxidase
MGKRKMDNIHKFKVEGIEGEEIDFAAFKGKKLIVVNVASECGFTPQYQQLQELYEKFGDKLVIVGFPANNFGEQEPGLNSEIRDFCSRRYGVTFPLASKIDVTTHPVYEWLTKKTLNGVMDSQVTWNFQKYLLDENGRLVNFILPSESPLNETVLEWLNG